MQIVLPALVQSVLSVQGETHSNVDALPAEHIKQTWPGGQTMASPTPQSVASPPDTSGTPTSRPLASCAVASTGAPSAAPSWPPGPVLALHADDAAKTTTHVLTRDRSIAPLLWDSSRTINARAAGGMVRGTGSFDSGAGA
jgi:hypothetical protein